MAVPYHCPEKEIYDFITQKVRWIFSKINEARQRQDIIQSKRFVDGREFLFLGQNFRLSVNEKEDIRQARIDFNGECWRVEIPFQTTNEAKERIVRAKMTQWYRQQAAQILEERTAHYSRLMELAPQKVAIRSFKRIWGNCDYHKKIIQFNWQLILSPLQVVDYVVVHELCHLVHPNHSRRFWKTVEGHMPDFRDHRRWLRSHSITMVLP